MRGFDSTALPALLVLTAGMAAAALYFGAGQRPGDPWPQLCAAFGAALVLVPLAFSLTKRSGLRCNAPAWFAGHVLAASAGSISLAVHVAGADLWSLSGLLVLGVAFLLVQGVMMRVVLGRGLARRFAADPSSLSARAPADRASLRTLLDAKAALLTRIDADAHEALFSPQLEHWRRHPLRCLRYVRLVHRELVLTGMRSAALLRLAAWRRLHMLVAALLFVGVLAHIVVVLFFAGYVAGGGPVYWWHVTALGGGSS